MEVYALGNDSLPMEDRCDCLEERPVFRAGNGDAEIVPLDENLPCDCDVEPSCVRKNLSRLLRILEDPLTSPLIRRNDAARGFGISIDER
jgi:hypothetical protein